MKKATRPAPLKVKDFLRRLGLICFKNLLLRKNQWFVTIMEVFFPIFGYLLIVYLTTGLAPDRDRDHGKGLSLYHAPAIPEFELKWPSDNCASTKANLDPEKRPFIAVTPDNPETRNLINLVVADICHDPPYSRQTGWIFVNDEATLEKRYKEEWKSKDNFLAGVVFTDDLKEIKQQGLNRGTISYKIRLRPGKLPNSGKILPKYGDKEGKSRDYVNYNGPPPRDDFRRVGPNVANMDRYQKSGFLGLQLAIDRAITKTLQNGQDFPRKISLQPFPYPGGSKQRFENISSLVFLYFVYSWGLCFMIPSITRNVVSEKETGISELLRLSGVSTTIQWLGWLFHTLAPQLITISFLTLFTFVPVGKFPVLVTSDPFLFWIILLLYVSASAAFCFLICSLCRKPTIALTVTLLLWIAQIITGIVVIASSASQDQITYWIRIGLSVFPNVALLQLMFNVSHLDVAVLDATDEGYGARWSSINWRVKDRSLYEMDLNKNSPVTNLEIMGILLADIVVFMGLAIYLECVLPSEHGVKRPWYLFNCRRGSRRQVTEELPPEVGTTDIAVVEDAKEGELPNMEGGGKGPNSKSKVGPDEKAINVVSLQQEPAIVTGFEPEPVGASVGVDIQGLVKRFGSFKMAVNGVSLRMFSGDIFALLGHNGAGKTTLISMLTGFFAPSAGTAYVNGYDIRKDLDKARESMGFCPQHNMLFNWLTVSQQLLLFGMLRGLSYRAAKDEISVLLTSMHVSDKSKVLAKKLSGGQKRKLCLSIALIGGTKVVVLDEPTSGMDPQARREIWDILLQLRGQRTILLTTHFMEEADVLGDRIGIMANGQLQCCGTAAFLKKYYGAGSTLKFTLYGAPTKGQEVPPSEKEATNEIQETHLLTTFKPSPESDAILALVQKHVPDAKYKTDVRIDQANKEVFLTLPEETAKTNVLSQMFVELSTQKEKLGINTIGLQQTTIDEVFLKVGSLADEQKHGGGYTAQDAVQEMDQETFQRAPRVRKFLFTSQFTALFKKKLIYSLQKWIVLTLEIIIPLVLFMVAIQQTNSLAKPKLLRPGDPYDPNSRSGQGGQYREDEPYLQYTLPTNRALPISLSKYSSPVTFYHDFENPKYIEKVIGSSAKYVPLVPDQRTGTLRTAVYDEITKAKRKDVVSYKQNHPVAARVNEKNFVAMFNLYPYHSAPLAINIATNTLLKYLKPNENYRIQVTNQPFYGTEEDAIPQGQSSDSRSGSESNSSKARSGGPFQPIKAFTGKKNATNGIDKDARNLANILCYLLPLGLFLLTSHFVVPPIEERLLNAKQLQTMTGVSPLTYWGASFCWDFLFYTVITFVMLIFLLIIDFGLGYGVISRKWAWWVLPVIIMTYGPSAILLSYLLSFRSNSVAGGFTKVVLIHIFLGLLLGMLIPDPGSPIYREDHPITKVLVAFVWILSIVGRIFTTYSLVRAIWYFTIAAATNNNCRLIAADLSQCPHVPYFMFTDTIKVKEFKVQHSYGYRSEPEIVIYEVPRILYELMFIILMGFVYFGLLMFIEYKIWRKICRSRPDPFQFPPNINDEDVYGEVERVNMLVTGGGVGTECFIVQNLSKSYGNFAAVSQLHFGVHYGECFGLLGVNGAGKTTAFRMITGDETPSMGTAYGFGECLEMNPNKFFSHIGYCPQFDAILPMFTGKQMLQLFAGLRGVPYKMRESEAMRWLSRMGLEESANVKCGRYSGGMKRRLSTAMAMIGDPMLILLDEPTSGVDPVSRRQFWKILDKMRESGQSIILTSHSMEECEALCSRLGIMVNGQFQCFGGVQHLKNKYAQGYSLTIKLKPDLPFGTPDCDTKVANCETKILQRFVPCSLKDKHQNLLQFHLQNTAITWDVLFNTMEEIKSESWGLIEDYSVNETSLEEIFLAFARVQHPERKANVKLCKQICTCSC